MHILVTMQRGCNLDFLFKSRGFLPWDSSDFYEKRTILSTEATAVKVAAAAWGHVFLP